MRMMQKSVFATEMLFVVHCLIACVANADSAVDLISGFDQQRVENAYPPTDEKSLGELAKLLYRVQKVDPTVLEKRAAESDDNPPAVGQVVQIEGLVKAIKRHKVPTSLVEFLEFETFYEVSILPTGKEGAERQRVVVPTLRGAIAAEDRISGMGFVLQHATADASLAIVVSRVKWFPNKSTSDGTRLLSQQGVDLSALADVSTRQRQPLRPDDGDAFYPMLCAAQTIGADAVVQPKSINPVELLKDPKKYVGQWLRIRVNTVRVTKVRVENPRRQKQLGKDHYFQIDASGDLGKAVIVLKRPEGEAGEPIRFQDYYPISLAVPELPDFLSGRIRKQDGDSWVVSMIDHPVSVDGFFFRLWSYSTDFMKRKGSGDQFGPLMIGARINDKRVVNAGSGGVEVIGYVAATAVVLGIALIAIWTRMNSKEDDAVRKKRQERESAEIKLS